MLRAKDVTPEIYRRAVEIAEKLKQNIETKFTREMSEEEHKELRALRKELQDMGILVEIDYVLALKPDIKLTAAVKLIVLKDNIPSA